MSLSAISFESSSSFVTSSEDDHALSDEPSDRTSDSSLEVQNRAKKVRDTPFSLKNERQMQVNETGRRVRSVSERFFKRRNGRDEFWDWRRPCVKNHTGFVIGDSMLRCFHKTGSRREGYRISAFGGAELLEIISLLRSGAILRNRDIRDKVTRDKILAREIELPLNKKCGSCGTNCTIEFDGQVLIAAGLNNSLHAADPRHVTFDQDLDNYVSDQNFEAIFELLDDTIKEMFPKATVRLAPLVAVRDDLWLREEMMQEAFVIINGLIRSRRHVDFDSYLPSERDWLCHDKIHFKDYDGVEFWKTILNKLK